MTPCLLSAVRRSACRIVAGSGPPPSPLVILATKSVDAAHAKTCRAWDSLFSRRTPAMDGAETDLLVAQYFYGLASTSLGRASADKATREGISASLRGATSDLMDGSTAVLRASARLRGEPSTILRQGASACIEGATNLLRASEAEGDHAVLFLDEAAGNIGAAARLFTTATGKIRAGYVSRSALEDWDKSTSGDRDLFNQINVQFESAKEAQDKVKQALQNFPFEVKEKHNCSDLILTRTYLDEEIEVVVCGPSLATDKADGSAAINAEAEDVLALQVTITKGSTLTMYTCSAFASELRVNTMYMRLTIGEEDKEEHEICFDGSESNETLQQLVNKYLELRGISMMTASFLRRLLSLKGAFVKMLWLDLLKGFVKPEAANHATDTSIAKIAAAISISKSAAAISTPQNAAVISTPENAAAISTPKSAAAISAPNNAAE